MNGGQLVQPQLCHLRYWLEHFRQHDCMKELTREIHATPSGYTLSNKQLREMKAAQGLKDAQKH